jgi:hypothetical protein
MNKTLMYLRQLQKSGGGKKAPDDGRIKAGTDSSSF